MFTPYENPAEYLDDYLSTLELEIERTLHRSAPPKGLSVEEAAAALQSIETRLAEERTRIQGRIDAGLDAGNVPPLLKLATLLDLDDVAVDLMLICAAPSLDARFAKYCAYLHGETSLRYPTFEVIAQLHTNRDANEGGAGEERDVQIRSNLRPYFAAHSPLFRHGILRYADHDLDAPLSTRRIIIDEHIVNYLLGHGYVNSELDEYLDVINVSAAAQTFTGTHLKKNLGGLAKYFAGDLSRNLYIQGPRGAGKAAATAYLCEQLDVPLIEVRHARLLELTNVREMETIVRRIVRDALLYQAALLFPNYAGAAPVGEAEPVNVRRLREIIAAELGRAPLAILTGGDALHEDFSAQSDWIIIAAPEPDYAERTRLWEQSLNGSMPANLSAAELAGKYRFTADKIRRSVEIARNVALGRGELQYADEINLSEEDIIAGCRSQCVTGLDQLARKIEVRHGWTDIVLQSERLRQLQEICDHVRHRATVYGEWGFAAGGGTDARGLGALFYGVPGTGKTLAASVIAGELGLELYRVDLSSVVSKYVGETEKNLARIFEEAEASNAILFFDEADALFGKRSEVRDSHDRYANLEVSYLLQRMEEFSGVTILATNLRANIDQAFTRRLQFIIEFPFPARDEREKIWRLNFPERAPIADDVDFRRLAGALDIAGGNIRNIARSAAFLGAADAGRIALKHIQRAVVREYQKDGKTAPNLANYRLPEEAAAR